MRVQMMSLRPCSYAALGLLAVLTSQAVAASGGLTIEGVTIIDGNGGAPVSGGLTIEGNRIVSTGNQQASDPQAYCINASADFYRYTGDPCRTGYQLGTHNCRLPDGEFVLASRADCETRGGLMGSPAPAAVDGSLIRTPPRQGDQGQ
jgi:hypothetical protein